MIKILSVPVFSLICAASRANRNKVITPKIAALEFGVRTCCTIIGKLLVFVLLSSLLAVLHANDAPSQDYIVRQGDTLYSLARLYGVSVNEVMRSNGLKSSTELKAGMLLKIPAPNFSGIGTRSEASTKSTYTTHVVTAGETLYAIAGKYAMPIGELRQLNGLGPSARLLQGQTLIVVGPKNKKQEGSQNSSNLRDGAAHYWPVAGRRESLDEKLQGVRILALDRSLVYAVRAGKVMWQGPYRSYGAVTLVASNDGYTYLYGGNMHSLVNTGQEISKGEPLGKVDAKVGNQLSGQSPIYRGANQQLATAKQHHSQIYFSVFRKGEFVPLQNAPRG